MFKRLMMKWFGLEEEPCVSCEILRLQLEKVDAERRELLTRLLDKDKEVPQPQETEMKPVGQQYVPWRVRQQMLEAEDRAKAKAMKEKAEEIEKLEKELGVT